MTEAQKCPVCDGSGKYPSSGWTSVTEVVCHGCNGKGWVLAERQEARISWGDYTNPPSPYYTLNSTSNIEHGEC